MSLIQLILKQMRQRALSTWLTLWSVMLGVAMAVAIMVLSRAGDRLFGQSDFGYDVLVGPKGSRLALVLNSVYQLGQSPGTIPYAAYEQLPQRIPELQWAVPFAVGDQYQGHRILSTTPAMFGLDDNGAALGAQRGFEYRRGRHYEIAAGRAFHPRKFEAVVGAEVAERNVLGIGSRYQPEHGLDVVDELSRDEHEEHWEVVGVLKRTGTASDRVIFTPLISFFAIPAHEQALREFSELRARVAGPASEPAVEGHEGHAEGEGHGATAPADQRDDHEHDYGYVLSEDGQIELRIPRDQWKISGVFVRTTGSGKATLEALWTINNLPEAMAVNPALEMQEFFSTFLRGSTRLLVLVALLVNIVAAVSILVSIYNSVSARMGEIAVLRALGATRMRILALICLEAGLIGLIGGVAGLIAGHLLAGGGSLAMQRVVGESLNWLVIGPLEGLYLVVVVLIALLAGLVPALKAYRSPVAANLVTG